MRAIDADAVPQEFWEYEFDGKWRGCTIKDLLDSQPTIQPEPHWIPVAERLPEKDSDILVTYVEKDEKRIVPVNYGCGTWFDCFFDKVLNPVGVLAWMPLPEPYKGVTE